MRAWCSAAQVVWRRCSHRPRVPAPARRRPEPPRPRPLAPTQSGIKYPVVVRFDTQNYAGVTTNNFSLDEVEAAK